MIKKVYGKKLFAGTGERQKNVCKQGVGKMFDKEIKINADAFTKNEDGSISMKMDKLVSSLSPEEIFEISKSEVQDIIDCIHDSIYITDGEGTTLMVNEASRAYLLRNPVPIDFELVGLNVKYMVDNGYWDNSICMNVIESNKPVNTIQEAFGAKLLSTGIPLYKDGKMQMVIATDRDISELAALQSELEKSQKTVELYESKLEYYRKNSKVKENLSFTSEIMKDLVNAAIDIAEHDVFVLIEGESGTGKEVLANLIVSNSPRKDNAYLRINCAAIPENLMESEFFGYEAGAFTGADSRGKAGYFEIANGGTILLDEVTELPIHMQSKLLRVIQEGEFMRVGGTRVIKSDVRIIAATNVKLIDAVSKGKFRGDLYYRLNVAPLEIPPLRDRKEDILHLVKLFLSEFNAKHKTNKEISNAGYNLFYKYDWPGNVRELKNVIERLVVTSKDNIIDKEFVGAQIYGGKEAIPFGIYGENMLRLSDAVDQYEKKLIKIYWLLKKP